MKIFKFLMLGAGLVLLLAVIGIGIFMATFDANQYKKDLSELVKQQTGRELSFSGDIGLTLYPALGMNLGSMEFSNAKGFGNQPMLAVKKASVSVNVLSLLAFSPKIDQLVLDGLTVDLQKNKQGKTNWDDLVASEQPSPATTKKSSEPADTTSAEPMTLTGAFGGLNITRANLTWTDATAGAKYQVSDLSLVTGEIKPDRPFALQLQTRLSSQNEVNAEINLTSEVLLKGQNLTLSGLKLKTTAQGELIPVDQVEIDLGGDVKFSLAKNVLGIQAFQSNIKSRGGVLQQADVSLAGEIGFDLNKQQLTIGVLDVQAELLDPSVPNGQMKAGISAGSLDMQLEKRSIKLEDLSLKLNENQFNGFVHVLDYAKPAVNFELVSNRFDVDSLMGKDKKETTVTNQSVEESSAPAEDVQIQLPMELMRSLLIDGQLKVKTLVAQGLTVSDVLLKVKAKNGVINLNPLSMNLYDGTFNGQVQVDARSDKPKYKVIKKLSSFQIGRFLQDFMGDDKISGGANLDVSLTTQGEWLSQLKGNLNGNLSMAINDGALKGFNLRHKIDSAKAKWNREEAPTLKEEKTDFSALSLSGLIKNGVVTTDDLNVQAPLIRVGGKGSANLVKESVDYLVNAKVVGTTKGQQGGAQDDLSGLLIPVAITGAWASPKIDVQLDEMLKAKFNADKEKIRGEVAKQKAALQQQLADEKAKLKASQQKKSAAQRAQLEKKRALAEAEQKAKLEAEKKRKKAELDAKKKAEKEKAKQKLKDKLKNLGQ